MHEALTKLKDAGFTVLEARLMGLSKARRKDGDWYELKIQVLPEEMPNNLYVVPLGTRMGVAMVEIGDDEQAVKPKQKFEDLLATQQAGIRCNDLAFQAWCQEVATTTGWPWPVDPQNNVSATARWVREQCGVVSRTELNEGEPFKKWLHLNAQFEADTRMAERRG